MDRFETQFEDLDVATGYYENATTSATAVGTPQEDVDRLMNQVADEAGVELNQEMEGAKAVSAAPVKSGPTEVEEDGLGERLGALRSWEDGRVHMELRDRVGGVEFGVGVPRFGCDIVETRNLFYFCAGFLNIIEYPIRTLFYSGCSPLLLTSSLRVL